jgi:hypothetical protein
MQQIGDKSLFTVYTSLNLNWNIKSIISTLLYTKLISFKENDYYVKVAHNVDEACELVKTGFQYVTGDYTDGGKIFRKPK